MTGRIWRRLTLLAALAYGITAAPGYADSGPGRVFEYQAYLGGVPVAAGGVEYVLGDGRYRLAFELRTEGMTSWFFPWTQTTTSQGVLPESATAGAVRVARHRSASIWRGAGRHMEIAWHDDVPRIESMEPARESDDHPDVPEEMTRGTLDPLSAVFAFGRGVGETASCSRTIAVFDGRRRYDMVGIDDGTEILKGGRTAPVEGEAVRCRFQLETIAGFPSNARVLDERRRLEGMAWFKQMAPDYPPVPVRIEMETGIGSLMLHLIGTKPSGSTAAAAGAEAG